MTSIAELLDAWRATRAPELAELLELMSLETTATALPPRPDDWWRHVDHDFYPTSWHPWRALPAPDPRTTVPLVLSGNHVHDLQSEHSPRWPHKLDEQLIAHGDQRALDMLDRMCHGRFANERRRLAKHIPKPRALDAATLANVRRMTAAVADMPAELRKILGRTSDSVARRQLIALGLRYWLPTVAWHAIAATFEGTDLVGIGLAATPESIAAIVGCAELATVRTLTLSADRFAATAEHPWLARNLVHRGAEVQRALVELIGRAPQLRAFHSVSSALARALVDAGVLVAWTATSAWHDGSLFEQLGALDPPLEQLSLSPLQPRDLESPSAIDPLWAVPVGRRLRELRVPFAVERWAEWLARDAVPEHVETLVFHAVGRRTMGAWASSTVAMV